MVEIRAVNWASLLVASSLLAVVRGSHGSLRSCYECSLQAKNYMCNWGNTLGDGLVACCEQGSTSLYCQPSVNNTCSPTFEVSKGMFFRHCPQITNDLCKTETTNLTLFVEPKKQEFEIKSIYHQNQTDYAAEGLSSLAELKAQKPDIFQACYYIIETDQNKFSQGTVKMQILEQKNMNVYLFAGYNLELAQEGLIEQQSNDEGEVWYTVDFTNIMVIVVTPQQNQEDTAFKFSYELLDHQEIDWSWRFYLDNFSYPNGENIFYVYAVIFGVILCMIVCGVCVSSYYCCCKPKVYNDPDQPGRRFSRRRSSKGSSLRQSLRRSMRLESIVEMSGQSFKRKGTMHRLINVHGGSGSPDQSISPLKPQKPGEAKVLRLDKMSDEQQQENVFAKNKNNQVATEYNSGNPEASQSQDQSMKQLI